MITKLVLAALGIILLLGVIVRLWPIDPSRWQNVPTDASVVDSTGAKSFAATRLGTADDLLALDQAIRETPRTQKIAGGLADGKITYVTRSWFWGFPDFTTIAVMDAEDGVNLITIYARAQYGGSDLGVNRRRVVSWLTTADLMGKVP